MNEIERIEKRDFGLHVKVPKRLVREVDRIAAKRESNRSRVVVFAIERLVEQDTKEERGDENE